MKNCYMPIQLMICKKFGDGQNFEKNELDYVVLGMGQLGNYEQV